MTKNFSITVTSTGQAVDLAQYNSETDAISCVVMKGTEQRKQIEGGIRFLLAEKAAASVDLECGLRVAC